jgi:hypothetical protein
MERVLFSDSMASEIAEISGNAQAKKALVV